MFSKFLTPQDYNGLMNCKTVAEAVSFLCSKTDYAGALAAANSAITTDRVEELLRLHMTERFEKISKYEMSIGDDFYRYFPIRNDINQIIVCLKYLDSDEDKYLDQMPPFFATHTEIDYSALGRAKTFEDVLAALEGTPYKKVLEPLGQGFGLLDAEAAFDKYIDGFMRDVLKKKKSKILLEIMGVQSDMNNIGKIYRCKSFGIEKEQIRGYLSRVFSSMTDKQYEMLLDASSADEVIGLISKTPYGKDFETSPDGVYFEGAAQKLMYKRFCKGIRFYTEPAAVLLCFVFLAENEVKNITHIIEGIRFGIPPEDIGTVLVGAQRD